MLSLSPRWDLFVFKFPKDFLPAPVEEKYSEVINRNKSVITKPIDYLNESIKAVTIPGISDLTIEQSQISKHNGSAAKTSKHIEVEPDHKNVTYGAKNPLDQINMEITVTLRQNQGLYNYFMMYETIFYKTLKQFHGKYWDDVFYIDLLDEKGVPTARIELFQPRVDSIDGLTFDYSKVERGTDTFDVKFKFNNINFDFLPNKEY